MTDTLRGVPEHVEAEFGDAILARDEAVAALGGGSPSLGPPDLAWLQKGQRRRPGAAGAAAGGYYHFVLGGDVGSSAAVAGYFAELTARVEAPGLLAGLWMGPQWAVERGFYCTYDAVSRTDLRAELCVPGGCVVGCVDAAGVLHEATPRLWAQAQVCAFCRAVLYDAEMRASGGSVLAFDPVPSPAAERQLLASVLGLFRGGHLPGALQEAYEDQGCGVVPEHTDIVCSALWQHFRRRQRWQAAADFFRQLAAVYSPAALLLAAAQRAQGLGTPTSGAMLAELLASQGYGPALSCLAPDSMGGGTAAPPPQRQLEPATLVGLAAELLAAGRPGDAAALARRALCASPRCRPAWLLLARCFVAQRQFAAALVALNVVPTPPLPAAEVELLHVVPPPPPKCTTQPQVRLYDGEVEAARWTALEEASLDGSRLLAYLPGAVLANREPLEGGPAADLGPNRITRSVLGACYGLLQEIVSQLSWDEFLEVRSRVFLMQQDPQAPHAAGGADAQAAAPGRAHDSAGAAAAAAQHKAATANGTATGRRRSSSPSQGGSPGAAAAAAAAGAGTPPPSRGRVGSAGAGGRRGGGDPRAYYASRLHDELAKPGTSSGASPTAAAAAAVAAAGTRRQSQASEPELRQQQQQQPGQQQPGQQQQHSGQQQQQPGQQQQQPGQQQQGTGEPMAPGEGEGERSMAGRVLLLGRTQARRLSTGGSRGGAAAPPAGAFGGGAAAAAAARRGGPRRLAPNEIEDLSRLATASRVAPIRLQPGMSINPQLFDVVFGERRVPAAVADDGGGGPPAPQQGKQRQPQASQAEVAASSGLPRIRTRPLGEAREDSELQQQQQLQQHEWRAQLQQLRASLAAASSLHQAGRGIGSGCAAAAVGPRRWRGYGVGGAPPAGRGRRGRCWLRGGCLTPPSLPSAAPGPLGEGLDRGGSLLLRTSSVASSVGPGATLLPSGGSIVGAAHGPAAGAQPRQLLTPRVSGGLGAASGSGAFGAALARRASTAGEAGGAPLDADREGLLCGYLADDEAAARGRRLCVRWLDELVVALWHDLQAHMEWKVWDQTLREARGGTHAELVLGLVPGEGQEARAQAAATVEEGGGITPPELTSVDWMRRGGLAERLGHVGDARAAYRASVKLGFNLTSYLALLRLEARAGNTSDTLLCATQVMAWHAQRAAAAGGGGAAACVQAGVPPDAVAWALGLLADGGSVSEVRGAAAAAPELLKAVDAWARWQGVHVPELDAWATWQGGRVPEPVPPALQQQLRPHQLG